MKWVNMKHILASFRWNFVPFHKRNRDTDRDRQKDWEANRHKERHKSVITCSMLTTETLEQGVK